MRSIRVIITAVLLGLVSTAVAQSDLSYLAPEKQRDGLIQELDFGSGTMIFQGYRYRMAPDVEVEIRGTYGAFTMLEKGMKARITYRVVSESDREVIRIEQLPDNLSIEEA